MWINSSRTGFVFQYSCCCCWGASAQYVEWIGNQEKTKFKYFRFELVNHPIDRSILCPKSIHRFLSFCLKFVANWISILENQFYLTIQKSLVSKPMILHWGTYINHEIIKLFVLLFDGHPLWYLLNFSPSCSIFEIFYIFKCCT